MITVRDHYLPSEKSDAPPHDCTHVRTCEQSYSWLCGLLAYSYSVREVKFDGTTVSIIVQERGRNTGSLFEFTFSGSLTEMVACLSAAYYWYDGRCVEPPLDYQFSDPGTRQRVLDDVQEMLPRRNTVGNLLCKAGYQPLVLTGLYDIRGCAPMWVGVMAYAGITDPQVLTGGAGMDFRKVFDVCEYVRVFGMSFTEALGHVECDASVATVA